MEQTVAQHGSTALYFSNNSQDQSKHRCSPHERREVISALIVCKILQRDDLRQPKIPETQIQLRAGTPKSGSGTAALVHHHEHAALSRQEYENSSNSLTSDKPAQRLHR